MARRFRTHTVDERVQRVYRFRSNCRFHRAPHATARAGRDDDDVDMVRGEERPQPLRPKPARTELLIDVAPLPLGRCHSQAEMTADEAE